MAARAAVAALVLSCATGCASLTGLDEYVAGERNLDGGGGAGASGGAGGTGGEGGSAIGGMGGAGGLGGSGGEPISCGFQDDFNDDQLGPQWQPVIEFPLELHETNQVLELFIPDAAPGRLAARIFTAEFDVDNCSAEIAYPTSAQSPPGSILCFWLYIDAQNFAGFVAIQNQLRFVHSINDALTNGVAVTLDASVQHWRISAADGNLEWETSADGNTWDVRRIAASGLDPSAMRIMIGSEVLPMATTTDFITAVFDDLITQ
jgi:hypothetical protein